MNLSTEGIMDDKEVKLNLSNRATALNPNAAEFIPSALRSTVGNTDNADLTRLNVPGASGKSVLDRSGSNISNNSDDEVHNYWRHQLPDDITPDFNFMVEDELQGPGHLSLAGLSIHNDNETSRLSASVVGQTLGTQKDISPLAGNTFSFSEKLGYSVSSYAENQPAAVFRSSAANSWDEQFVNGANEREGHHYNADSTDGYLNDLFGDYDVTADAAINPVEFLALQFPGFAAESLADVYYANGCDLNLTIEILTQLELQVDGSSNQNLNSKSLAAPSFNVLDFPALPISDTQNGLPKYTEEDLQQASNAYRYPSNISRGATDFASTVRKLASQESGCLNHERNGSTNAIFSTNRNVNRSSQLLSSKHNGHKQLVSGDKSRNFGAAQAAPVWLETGEAVANMYSESREEARDFARLRNVCFEQARQAYLIGSKALAKELSVKGQLYNMKMKEAHAKATETIYRQRNPVSECRGYGREQDCLIDLHGLHVSEAIHVLKHELSTLRSTARSAGKRLQVMICVGTGHHTKGSRTPARLPVAVEQYLLEESLHYTQPQPGLLRVVIH